MLFMIACRMEFGSGIPSHTLIDVHYFGLSLSHQSCNNKTEVSCPFNLLFRAKMVSLLSRGDFLSVFFQSIRSSVSFMATLALELFSMNRLHMAIRVARSISAVQLPATWTQVHTFCSGPDVESSLWISCFEPHVRIINMDMFLRG